MVLALGLLSCGPSPVTPAAPSPVPTSQQPSAPASPLPPTPTLSPSQVPTSDGPATHSPSTARPTVTPTTSSAAASTTKVTASAAPSSTRTETTATPSTSTPRPTLTTTPPAPATLVQLWAGQDIEVFTTQRRVVALTFDGGASADAVTPILATLAAHGVPATFFVTGQFARAYPDAVRAMDRAGHPVGNHSDTHPYFTRITNEEIRAQLTAAERSISALTGTTTKPLFRFPYGDVADLDIRVVNGAGYIPVRWTVDTLGWKGTSGGITTAVVRQRILDRLQPGAVVLMHVGAHPEDGSTLDSDALPGIISDLHARGYGFATLPDLLDDAP